MGRYVFKGVAHAFAIKSVNVAALTGRNEAFRADLKATKATKLSQGLGFERVRPTLLNCPCCTNSRSRPETKASSTSEARVRGSAFEASTYAVRCDLVCVLHKVGWKAKWCGCVQSFTLMLPSPAMAAERLRRQCIARLDGNAPGSALFRHQSLERMRPQVHPRASLPQYLPSGADLSILETMTWVSKNSN